MANSKKLNKWFLDHASELDLKIGRGEWINKWCPSYFDFKAQIKIDGVSFTGRGVDSDMDIAFSKACVEAVERSICFEHKLRSSGVAGHFCNERARKNARNELIERDVFLCHYLARRAFESFYPTSGLSINYEDIINRLAGLNMKMLFLKTSSFHLQVVLCICILDNGGVIIGLSASESLKSAAEKAFFECLTNTVSYLDGNSPKAMNTENFKKVFNHSPMDHFKLNLSKDSSSRFSHVASEKKSEVIKIDSGSIGVDYKELKSKNSLIDSSPIVFIKADSLHLQNMFYGETAIEKVNLVRLSKFSGNKLSFDEIEQRIHPLG